MSEAANVDVMNNLLFSSGSRDLPQVKELNSILYQVEGEDKTGWNVEESDGWVVPLRPESKQRDRVQVEVDGQHARIRIKVPRPVCGELSMEQVAEAAAEAIHDKLKKVMT